MCPRQPTRQYRERVLEIDYLLQAGSKKVVGHGCLQVSISLSFRCPLLQLLRVSDVAISMNFHVQSALQAFCRGDEVV